LRRISARSYAVGIVHPAAQNAIRARMRFLAFTAQFVEREFDPLGL